LGCFISFTTLDPAATFRAMPHRDVVLVAEDSDEDFFFLERAAKKVAKDLRFHRVPGGREAIDYLAHAHPDKQSPKFKLPKLILLDLKMPSADGFEVLRWLSSDQELKRLPVVVYSNSAQPRDMRKAYDLGANGYTTKPDTFDELVHQVCALRDYWMQQNRVCHEIG
jgi:CheY-like chemotaxis protein